MITAHITPDNTLSTGGALCTLPPVQVHYAFVLSTFLHVSVMTVMVMEFMVRMFIWGWSCQKSDSLFVCALHDLYMPISGLVLLCSNVPYAILCMYHSDRSSSLLVHLKMKLLAGTVCQHVLCVGVCNCLRECDKTDLSQKTLVGVVSPVTR